MSKLFKYFTLTFFLPFWHLQKLLKRKKNIWVFGAWNGQRFSDNSKYLFEHVSKNGDEIRAIWLTKNREILIKLRDGGQECYLTYSFKGIYFSLKAKYIFVSCEKKDVNFLFVNGAVLIHLWHGNPLKKIGLDDHYSAVNGFLYSKIVRYVFPMIYEFNYNYMVSNSKVFTPLMQSSYDLTIEHILETGCPRNDVFYQPEKDDYNLGLLKKFPEARLVYYLPTFRNSKNPENIFTQPDFENDMVEEFLENENIVLINKGHYVEAHKRRSQSSQNSRIIHLKDSDITSDINFMLKDADALITDYSSAFFDFLLTERPIIFAAFDLQDYMSKSRELYFEYENAIAGPMVKNWNEILFQLKHIWDNEKNMELVKQKNVLYNKYHDCHNSKRVMNAILTLS